jgi:hypothetical protein
MTADIHNVPNLVASVGGLPHDHPLFARFGLDVIIQTRGVTCTEARMDPIVDCFVQQ